MPDLTLRDKQELSNKDNGADEEEYDEQKSRGMMAHSEADHIYGYSNAIQ